MPDVIVFRSYEVGEANVPQLLGAKLDPHGQSYSAKYQIDGLAVHDFGAFRGFSGGATSLTYDNVRVAVFLFDQHKPHTFDFHSALNVFQRLAPNEFQNTKKFLVGVEIEAIGPRIAEEFIQDFATQHQFDGVYSVNINDDPTWRAIFLSVTEKLAHSVSTTRPSTPAYSHSLPQMPQVNGANADPERSVPIFQYR